MVGKTIEEKIADIQNLRPIDDVFFEVLAGDKKVCEEILRVIFEDAALVVEDVITQSSERNFYGRSVRLDALCILGNGARCNIEVQRSNNDNHIKRVRFNASNITVKDSQVGDKFENISEVYVVYISEFDIFKQGRTIYHEEPMLIETNTVIDNGLHVIYVNTAIDDGSTIADLMNCFTKKEVNNPKFPEFSRRVTELKTTEGGVSAVCEIMEKYMDKSKAEGKVEGKIEALKVLITQGVIDIDKAVDSAREMKISEEEIKQLYN